MERIKTSTTSQKEIPQTGAKTPDIKQPEAAVSQPHSQTTSESLKQLAMTVKLPVETRFESYLHACVLANTISESITGCVYVVFLC